MLSLKMVAGMVVASNVVYVNTIPTRSTPWMVAYEITPEVHEFEASETTINFLESVKREVLSLPAKVSIPAVGSALPRYYMVVLEDVDTIKVVDIVGIRRDGSPTKWNYGYGYWHPQCQLDIASILEAEVKRIRKALEKVKQAQEQKVEVQA